MFARGPRVRFLSVGVILFLVIPVLMSWSGCGSRSSDETASDANDSSTVSGVLPDHPCQLVGLTRESRFPRFTPQELTSAGYPDNMHEFTWPTWQPLIDESGQPYGPKTLCVDKQLIAQPDLVLTDSSATYHGYRLVYNKGYAACDMLPFMELLDWARVTVADLLELSCADTLTMINPDNTPAYLEQSGYGTWRLYNLQGDHCIVQCVPVLMARTLIAHAAFQLVVQWTLRCAVSEELPPWFEHGLMAYLAEDGVHLNNYMAQFRPEGPVLLGPDAVNEILAAGVNPDAEADRKLYRQACYAAFLMVWELIENRGGLAPVRRFLHAVADGTDPDKASRKFFRHDLADLAAELDPLLRPEPIGEAVQPRKPSRPPATD